MTLYGQRYSRVIHGTGADRLSDVEPKDSHTVSEDGNDDLEQSVM